MIQSAASSDVYQTLAQTLSGPSARCSSRSPLLFSCSPRPSVRSRYPHTMLHDLVEYTLRFLSDMDYKQAAAFGGAATAIYAMYRRYSRISLDDVPGPENPSFLHGAFSSDSQLFLFLGLNARAVNGGCLQGMNRLCRLLRRESSRTTI